MSITQFIFLIIFSIPIHFSLALPAPMSDQELQQKSDIVGKFRILAVTRSNDIEQFHQTLPTYQAWVQAITIAKGNLQPHDTIIIEWHGLPKGLLGPWQVPYHPGEIVETHLKKNPDGKYYYTSTWWNAANQITSSKIELPSQIGSITAVPLE